MYIYDKLLYKVNVIFVNAIQKIKRFSKFEQVDVEQSLRTFIAGAKFRRIIENKNKANITNHCNDDD